MKLYLLIAVSFLLTSDQKLVAQTVKSQELQILKALETYRSELLNQSTYKLYNLKHFSQKWDSIATNQQLFNNLISNVSYQLSITKRSPYDIYQHLKHHPDFSDFTGNISEFEFEIIGDNLELFYLIKNGVLEHTYPFKIAGAQEVVSEIIFYEPKQFEYIANIGAGFGVFSKLFIRIYPLNQYFLNEINPHLHAFIQSLLKSDKSLDTEESVHFVLGNERKTKLPKERFDKIFIRSSLHHFEYHKPMLRNIRKCLKEDGALFVKEPYKTSLPTACPHVVEKTAIEAMLDKAGFEIIDSLALKDYYILKLRMKL